MKKPMLKVIAGVICAAVLMVLQLEAAKVNNSQFVLAAQKVKLEAVGSTNVAMKVGESKVLKIKADTTENLDLKWSSDNKYVATVDKNGKVKAKTTGYVDIRVKDKKSKASLTFKVYITDIKETTINVGGKYMVQTYGMPWEGGVWSTSNKNIATVKDGCVTGKKSGKVTITYKSQGLVFKMPFTVTTVKKAAMKAYMKCLTEGIEVEEQTVSKITYFNLLDVNKDGIPELVFNRGENKSKKGIYGVIFYNREAACEMYLSASWTYDELYYVESSKTIISDEGEGLFAVRINKKGTDSVYIDMKKIPSNAKKVSTPYTNTKANRDKYCK